MVNPKCYSKAVKITLTLEEMFELAAIIAENDFTDRDWSGVKSRKMRKWLVERWEKRHKLWLKIEHLAQRNLE
jgi:hypothetical protein